MAILNAAPIYESLGAKDLSTRPVPVNELIVGSHTPLVFLFAAKGPDDKLFLDSGRALRLYGSKTFDREQPYFQHGTKMAEIANGTGSNACYVRLIPEDNNKIANVTVYVDVLKDDVDVLKRNEDGSIYYDADGNTETAETVKGYKLKVFAVVEDTDPSAPMGTKTAKTGHMTDANGNASTMYPVMEFRAKYRGKDYNNVGVAFEIPTNDEVNTNLIEKYLALPYNFYVYNRDDEDSTGKPVKNLYDTIKSQFIFAENAKDPVSGSKVDLPNVYKLWYNTSDPLMDIVYPDMEDPYVYYDNINNIQKNFLEVEKAYINTDVTTAQNTTVNTSQWLDFLPDVDVEKQYGIINILNAESTKRVPAFTYIIDNSTVTLAAGEKELYISAHTPAYMGGGVDGTLTRDEYEKQVREFMKEYLDTNSRVMDYVLNPENVLYDTGFNMETKDELVNFITVRKDTFVVLGDYQFGEDKLDLEEHRARGVSLLSRLLLAPESTFYGTPVVRGMIVIGSGVDKLDPNSARYPLTLHIARKAGDMMAGETWNANKIFDMGQYNTITTFADIDPAFVPKGIKPTLWDIGLVWPEARKDNEYAFLGLQTVYSDDTSIFNNFFAGMALTNVEKIAASAHKNFSGNVKLKKPEFIKVVETYMESKLKNKFAGIIDVDVNVTITDIDAIRGYSWSATTKLSGEVMMTVMTNHTEGYRRS